MVKTPKITADKAAGQRGDQSVRKSTLRERECHDGTSADLSSGQVRPRKAARGADRERRMQGFSAFLEALWEQQENAQPQCLTP